MHRKFFFVTCISVIILILLTIVLRHQPAQTIPHASVSSMLSGLGKIPFPLIVLGTLAGTVIIGILCYSIYIGTASRNNSKITRIIWVCFGLYILVFLGLTSLYLNYDFDQAYFLGFPLATIWMLLGVGGIPLVLTYFFYFKFDEWIISDEELADLHQLIKSDNHE